MNRKVYTRPNRRKISAEKLVQLIQTAEKISDKGTERVVLQRAKLFK